MRHGVLRLLTPVAGLASPPRSRAAALTGCCGSHTFEYMKDAVITVRLPRAARRRIEQAAREEGRSLSQQVERLLERGLAAAEPQPRVGSGPPRKRALSGVLRAGRVPTLADFRQARSQLSTSLVRRLSR